MKRLFANAILCAVSATVAAGLLLLLDGNPGTRSSSSNVSSKAVSTQRNVRVAKYRNHTRYGQRFGRMERRLRSLEQAKPNSNKAEHDSPESSVDTGAQEQSRKQLHSKWHAQLDAHDDDTRDDTWAPSTESAFVTDLSALSSAHGFEFVSADCKTDTCTAKLAFNSYGDALARYGSLLHHDYTTNCARGTVLPEPSDAEARYVATVLYDCGENTSEL